MGKFKLFSQWKSVKEVFASYWSKYGGFKSLLLSPYFQTAILITLLTVGFWFGISTKWWERVISVIPNLLGFTLGGFAIFLGFGSDDFRNLMAPKDEKQYSPYMDVVSSFMHFVMVQIIALVFALIVEGFYLYGQSKALPLIEFSKFYAAAITAVSGFLGMLLFIYSIMLAIAACVALYKLADLYSEFETHK